VIESEEAARRLARSVLEDLIRDGGEAALGDEARLSEARALFAARVAMPLVTLLDEELAQRKAARAPAPEPTLGGEEPRAPVGLGSRESLTIALFFALLALVMTLVGLWSLRR
jgi:hypothetical protein